LPEFGLRILKNQAAQSVKSLKFRLNEPVAYAMTEVIVPAQLSSPVLPELSRISSGQFKSVAVNNSGNLADAQLQDDLDKLRRSGFIR
jgi:hypothetical protein